MAETQKATATAPRPGGWATSSETGKRHNCEQLPVNNKDSINT